MKGKALRVKIMETIEREWPLSITESARHIGLHKDKISERDRKAIVAKIVYHVRKLESEEKVRLKKIGKTSIIWPVEIEKLRILHELIK